MYRFRMLYHMLGFLLGLHPWRPLVILGPTASEKIFWHMSFVPFAYLARQTFAELYSPAEEPTFDTQARFQ